MAVIIDKKDERIAELNDLLAVTRAEYERQWNDLLAVSRQADKLNREMYPQFRESEDG